MAITNLSNPAAIAEARFRKTLISFTTDAAAAITTTATSSAGGNGITVASAAGLLAGDAITIENGDTAGTGPWMQQINTISALNLAVDLPSVRTAVTSQTLTRWERFETFLQPAKIVLRNKGTQEEYVWDKTMGKGTARYIAASGAKSTLALNAIRCMTTCFAIHPNLLPISSTFEIELEF